MTEIKIKNFLDIQDAVLKRERQDLDNDEIRDLVKGFINYRYQEIAGETSWRWKRSRRVLKIIGRHTTGTVAVTNNSRSLTFTSASITAVMVNRYIRIGSDDESYKILSVNTVSQTAVIDNFYIGSTATGQSYTIYKDEYGLAPDIEDIDDVTNHYSRGSVKRKSPEYIYERSNQSPFNIGKPRYITVEGLMPYEGIKMGSGSFVMGHDFMGRPESVKAKIWPSVPDADYSIPYIGLKRVKPLDADTDEPLMFRDDRVVLVWGAAADLALVLKDETAYNNYETKYAGKLKQMLTDNQETDDQLQLVVEDVWRRDPEDDFYYSRTTFDNE